MENKGREIIAFIVFVYFNDKNEIFKIPLRSKILTYFFTNIFPLLVPKMEEKF